MSKEMLNTDPRPKCRAHTEGQVSLAGRARLGIPKLDTRVDADVRAVRGATHHRDGAARLPRWRPRQSHLAQRPGREKRKTRGHSCTSHTEQHRALRSFTHSLTHSCAARRDAQHNRVRSESVHACARFRWGDVRRHRSPCKLQAPRRVLETRFTRV